MGINMKKAEIQIVDKGTNLSDITVMFNPAEYSLSSSVKYNEKGIPGIDGPIMQYVAGNTDDLTITLFFDTFRNGKDGMSSSVIEKVTPIRKLVEVCEQLHRPPICKFVWGGIAFQGVVMDVKQNITMFEDDGIPVRAKVDVTFKSVLDLATNKKALESPDRTKVRVIQEGMQLYQLAWEEYGDVEMWKVIAKENGILDPLDIVPGQQIKVPAITPS